MPCTEKRARLLLERGRARVHRLVPLVIRLVDRQVVDSHLQPVRLKLDPGSKATGLAVVRETERADADTGEIHRTAAVLNLMELLHRGRQISEALTARRNMRRRRRGNLRYRAPRFLNRRNQGKGWLAPSLQHRIDTTLAWVTRLQRWVPVTAALPVEIFMKDKARLERIQAQSKCPLKDAAAVNSTRWALVQALNMTGLPVKTASGWRTKYNRVRLELPKTHALDAVCVGAVDIVTHWNKPTLTIKCTGRGSYQRTRLDKYGFPRGYLMRTKCVKGFVTGDLVRAEVPKGKKAGSYLGRVAIRATGSFNIQTGTEVVQGISHKHCRQVQRADGWLLYSTAELNHGHQAHRYREGRQSDRGGCRRGLAGSAPVTG